MAPIGWTLHVCPLILNQRQAMCHRVSESPLRMIADLRRGCRDCPTIVSLKFFKFGRTVDVYSDQQGRQEMMKTFSGCVIGLAIALVGLVHTNSTMAQDVSVLAGQWKPTSGSLHGQTVPPSALQSMSLTINGSTFSAISGSLNSGGTITLTPGKADEATFLISSGSDTNRNLYVKWQVTGNQLKLAFSEQSAPIDFNSTAGNKYLVLNYEKGGAATGPASGGTTQLGSGGNGGTSGIE